VAEPLVRTMTGARVGVPTALSSSERMILTLSRIWPWVFLLVMIGFFVVAVPAASGGSANFLTTRNSQNILVAIIPILLLGLGQTFVIIGAGIDLSVG
jgi:ribose/xylose/arabinose/galactoside ABC-type transport system permease subunit